MPKLPTVTDKEIIRALKFFGFFEQRQRGSHVMMAHYDGRKTIVALHSGKTIPKGTLLAILRNIQISREEFLEALK